MATPICRPCLALPCDNPADLAAGIDGAIYSQLDYSFEVTCPVVNGVPCFCPPGLFPQTISILASTIPPVIPPIIEPGSPIILRLQGCTSLITRTLSTGSSQAQIAAAAQSMQAEWAGQQALCIAKSTPGVNCSGTSDFITVCNDPQTIICRGVSTPVPANLYCQRLYTTGLTSDQIAAATATLKTTLNSNAAEMICPYLNIACTFASDFQVPGPGNGFQIFITNLSATKSFNPADPTTLITTHHVYGGNIVLDQTASGPTILPGQVNIGVTGIGGIHGPTSNEVDIYLNGTLIFSYTQNWANYLRIFMGVNCGV